MAKLNPKSQILTPSGCSSLNPRSKIPAPRIARGSIEETKYHLRLAKDLGYLDEEKYEKFKNEYETVGKMLNGLINSINQKQGED